MSDTSTIITTVLALIIVAGIILIVFPGIYRDNRDAAKKVAIARDRAAKEQAAKLSAHKPGDVIKIKPDDDAPLTQVLYKQDNANIDLIRRLVQSYKSIKAANNAQKKLLTDAKRHAIYAACGTWFPPKDYPSAKIGQMYLCMLEWRLEQLGMKTYTAQCWDEGGNLNANSSDDRYIPVTKPDISWQTASLKEPTK